MDSGKHMEYFNVSSRNMIKTKGVLRTMPKFSVQGEFRLTDIGNIPKIMSKAYNDGLTHEFSFQFRLC